MPLFRVLSYPEVHLFRMELVTIIDFVSWDAGSAHPGSSPQPVMTFAGAPQRLWPLPKVFRAVSAD